MNIKNYLDKKIKDKINKQADDAYKQARNVGVKPPKSGTAHNNEYDAFRHAYVSAKQTRDNGTIAAHVMGTANEIKGNLFQNQPSGEWIMDEYNNRVGREIGKRAAKENWSDERIAKEVKKHLDDKKLIIDPNDKENNRKKINDFYKQRRNPVPERLEHEKQSSILDGAGSAVGKVGDAVAGVGRMAFDAISNIDTNTLVHMVTAGGNGNTAAKIAMAQALGRMHSLVMREVDMQTQQGGIMSERIMIPEPDATTKEAIEGTLNNPANAEVFDKVGAKIEAILKDANDVDPARLLVSKVMEVLRGGGIQIEPNILIPDLLPQEDGEARKPKKGENVIEIAGIQIPIRLPEIRLPEQTGRGPDFNPNAKNIVEGEFDSVGGRPKIGGLHRGADGAIEVKAYVRGDGTQVRSHSRTAPDDILANNFSFKK